MDTAELSFVARVCYLRRARGLTAFAELGEKPPSVLYYETDLLKC
jgi:hypothetical protein